MAASALASAWSRAASIADKINPAPYQSDIDALKNLLEPGHPLRCAFYDSKRQVAQWPEAASVTLANLDRLYSTAVASSSRDTRPEPRIASETLIEWYIGRCEDAFGPICSSLLSPLTEDIPQAMQSHRVPDVFDSLAQWMDVWAAPLLPGGLLESPTAAKRQLLSFHTLLRLHIDELVLQSVRTFLARAIPNREGSEAQSGVDRLASSAEALGLSAMVLTLLTSVLHSEISRKVKASLCGKEMAEDDDFVWPLEEPARDRLLAWLDGQVKPRFRSVLDRCTHKAAGQGDADADAMDLSDEADRIVEEEFSDEKTWATRLDFHLDRTLCSTRAAQLFDLIVIYPDSLPALEDLRIGLERTDEKLMVARLLSESLQARLLHPGAHTRDIIQVYVHMVRALREVDPSGVVLSRVVSPLRRYLRARKDTIAVIVSSLLGDDARFTLLKDELEAADAESADEADTSTSQRRRRRRRSMPKGSRKRGATTGDGYRSSTSSSDESDYDDPDWQPKPVDAGREYRLSTSRDIIGMLISIFDDRADFISALEASMAEQLVRVRGYRATREHRNNLVLRKRFGEKNMGRCDVMLGDVTESRRVDAGVHLRVERERRNYAAAGRAVTKEERDAERGMNEVLDALHPLVVSRQFWPDLSPLSSSSASAGAATAASTTAGSTTTALAAATSSIATASISSSRSASAPTKLPERFARAAEAYNASFKASKAMRRLEWLLHLGSVEVEVCLDDGRRVAVECSVLEACVVELAASASAADGAGSAISVDLVVEQLGLEGAEEARRALAFWCRLGVLREVQGGPGQYEVVEHQQSSDERGSGTMTS